MGLICPGYIGIARIDDVPVRCTDFTMQVNQEPLFYDHIVGLNDTVTLGLDTKGEEVGTIQTQRRIWRPSVIGFSGSITFPANSETLQKFFDYAKYGNYFDLSFRFYDGRGRTFTQCRINTFQFSITAGDILNINADIWALRMEERASSNQYIRSEKLITWDIINIDPSVDVKNKSIQTLEFTIDNKLQYIYTADPDKNSDNKYLPRDLRIGTQEVNGSMGIYFDDGKTFLNYSTELSFIEIKIENIFKTRINVVFNPKQISGAIGPVITNVPFVGVDKAFGE